MSAATLGSLPPSRSLELLIEGEGSAGLGDHEYTPYSLSMWSHVRWLVGMQMADAMFARELVARLPTAPASWIGRARYAARAVAGSWRWHARRPFPIVFFSSGVGNFLRDGAYFNRLSDYFADTRRDDTFLIEDSDNGVFRRPRQFPNFAYHDSVLVRAAAEARLHPVTARDQRRIDDFVALIDERFGEHLRPGDLDAVRAQLAKYARWCHAWRSEYLALFDRLRPRLIFVEDASYGQRSHLIRWARDAGITTAEYQHGYIGANHEAYHYHPKLVTGPYRRHFPDYFLTYGRYWGDQMATPSERVVIGNPHLSEAARRLRRTRPDRALLFVSGDMNTQLYRELLPQIAAALPAGVKFVFRPHPCEYGTIDGRYGDLIEKLGIEVDYNALAYQSVADADLVIGDVSTLLFEADALGKPVAILDYVESRKIIPTGLFPFVSDVSQLTKMMPRENETTPTTRADLWAPDWERNYRVFIERVTGL